MANPFIVASRHDLPLRSSPIEPSWIKGGNPEARSAEIARSQDGTATTLVWECTPGQFDWFYDFDESIHIVSGAIVVSADGMEPTRFGPGDVIFFAKGAHAHWTVEEGPQGRRSATRCSPASSGSRSGSCPRSGGRCCPSRQPAAGALLAAPASA